MNLKPKFKKFEKAIFIDPYGVNFGEVTICEIDLSADHVRYFYEESPLPWFSESEVYFNKISESEQLMTKHTRGGSRPNAGRPTIAETAKNRTIRLTDADWKKFKSIGGVPWLIWVMDKEPK